MVDGHPLAAFALVSAYPSRGIAHAARSHHPTGTAAIQARAGLKVPAYRDTPLRHSGDCWTKNYKKRGKFICVENPRALSASIR